MKPTSLLALLRAGFPALLVVVLALAACRQEPPPEPVVDMTPVGDDQLEDTLQKFHEELLTRSAEDYRHDRQALGTLTQGLERLRQTAVGLARADAREVAARFGSGSLGRRRLAVA